MSKTLQFPALREKLTGEAMQNYVADINTPLVEFNSICLSDKSYGIDAATTLAPILAQLTSLTHADLSDIIAAQHEDIAKEVMRTVTEPLAAHASLTSLDMSNNAMGLKGMVAIERLLCERRDTLYHVYFNNCGNEADAVEHLGRCLLPTPESTTKLRTLQMARNCLVHAGCDEVTKIVARSPLLTSLRVSGTRVPMKGMQHLVETMLAMPELRLTSLDLSDNSFGSHESVLALARFLRSPQCSTLEHLNISMTQLGTEGLRLVSRAIRHSAAPLKSLDLSISDANVSATSSLAAALLSKPTLETVLLNHNFFRHAGGDLVFRTLAALPALLTASLNGTQLNSTSVPGAIKLIRAMGVRQGVKLNLNSNYFSEDSVEQLLEAGEDSHVALGTFDDNDADMEEEYYDEEYDDVEDEDQHEMQVEAALLSAAATEAGAAAASAAACDAAVAELAATVQTELKM